MLSYHKVGKLRNLEAIFSPMIRDLLTMWDKKVLLSTRSLNCHRSAFYMCKLRFPPIFGQGYSIDLTSQFKTFESVSIY